MKIALGALLAALAAAPVRADHHDKSEGQGAGMTGRREAPPPGPAMKVPPEEIVGVIKTNNDIEIKMGKRAQEKAQSQDVKRFARMMEQHHRDSNRQLKDARADTGGGDASEALEAKADQESETLDELEGAQFDKAYMAQQVEAHRSLLKSIDEALKNRKVLGDDAALVEKTRGVVQKHLQEAERIERSLSIR